MNYFSVYLTPFLVATNTSNIKRSNFFFAYINHWFVKADISFLLVTNLFVSNMVFSHMQTACTIKQNLFSIQNNSYLSILLDTSQLSFKFNKSINSAFNEKWTRAFRDILMN